MPDQIILFYTILAKKMVESNIDFNNLNLTIPHIQHPISLKDCLEEFNKHVFDKETGLLINKNNRKLGGPKDIFFCLLLKKILLTLLESGDIFLPTELEKHLPYLTIAEIQEAPSTPSENMKLDKDYLNYLNPGSF